LPPTTFSQKATKSGLWRSLFDRLKSGGHIHHMLKIQYRMHKEIRQYPSDLFYNGQLKDDASILTRRRPDWVPVKPAKFFDLQRSVENWQA